MEIKIDAEGEAVRPDSQRKNLRVLHIGNIANNAYLNAKILNEAGFECDILCYSYYHIMGNPEWEDADFVGDAGSEFLPDWNKVNLRGFHRPRWFAQGPLDFCARYLTARRQKKWWREQLDWYLLGIARFVARYTHLLVYLAKLKRRIKGFLRPGYKAFTKMLHITYTADSLSKASAAKNSANEGGEGGESTGNPDVSINAKLMRSGASISAEDQLYQYLALNFSRAFPERTDQLLEADIEAYLDSNYGRRVKMLASLFGQYDVIQAYGTDPILALLSGVHPYIAFEHGTIRSIPFEDNPQGRLTALAYRMADGVIITNCDNKRAAERLKLPDYRFIPHPINEKWIRPGIGKALRESLLRELNANFIIFHPARQHWTAERHPSWEKGNDILIEGMARVIHETGMNLGAVFVEWGQKIAQSKALIARLGIEKNIKWVPPVHSANMARFIDACDLLADQFFLGAFGSTMPRALALGKPAMIYIDEEIHRWCFPEMPPVINARTPDQVYDGLKHALEDPSWLADLAQDGRNWYQKYHSSAVIRDRLILFYEDVLKKISAESISKKSFPSALEGVLDS